MNTNAFTIPISTLTALTCIPNRLASREKRVPSKGENVVRIPVPKPLGRLSPHDGRRSFRGCSSGTCPSLRTSGDSLYTCPSVNPGHPHCCSSCSKHLQTTGISCIHSSEVRRTLLHAVCSPHCRSA